MSTSEQVIPTTYKDLEKENFATRIAIKLRLWLEKIKGSSVEELERKRLEREWAEVRDIRLSLDYKALCNKLNPIERGQEDGAKQYPPSGQEAYEQFHIDLITTANQEISQQAGRRMEVFTPFWNNHETTRNLATLRAKNLRLCCLHGAAGSR